MLFCPKDWSVQKNCALFCTPLTPLPPVQASVVPGEGNPNQTLYWATSQDAGESWSAPRKLFAQQTSNMTGSTLPYWSPVLHVQVSCNS